jgi:quercetin dioxygenase-like cupin family protein
MAGHSTKTTSLQDNADMTPVVLTCERLATALDFYTESLDFRIDSIFPADAPRRATLSGYGLTLQLRQAHDSDPTAPPERPGLVVTRLDEGGFGAGRAGMQYRDLVPDRFGGQVIASHIRIPGGGPVPDYVHHHDVRFQMIFCINGWVRVVYEDQGEPMRMQAGDCFLQPPHIRHRVLECSDAMEVIEIASPAEHETAVDHDMQLPTAEADASREFGGQQFVFSQASGANWLRSDVPGIDYRNLGIAAATKGLASAVILRSHSPCGDIPLRHDGVFRFLYLLTGTATLEGADAKPMAAGTACAIPGGLECVLQGISADFECLDVLLRRG